MVAVEQHFSGLQKIIEDPFAYSILPPPMRAFVLATWFSSIRDWVVGSSEKLAPGIWGGILCRKRYIDEKLIEAADKMEALVNLGAGFDTRAYRLWAFDERPLWEVDQRENIEPKQARLQKLFKRIPEQVKLLPVDLNHEDLEKGLISCGYSARMRTFFILEAVTQYLSEGGIRSTFDFLAKAASGSRLAFTYILKDFIAGSAIYGQKALYDRWVLQEKTWLYGMDPNEVRSFLDGYGWRMVESPENEELHGRYVRPTGRSLASTPLERVAYAEKR